jgi:hypothetical protein
LERSNRFESEFMIAEPLVAPAASPAEGIYPQPYFRQRLEEEAHRAHRMHTILTLVLIQGDPETLTHTLREGIRRMDVIGFWKEYVGVLMSEIPREEVAPAFTDRLSQQAQGVLRVAGVVDTEWQEISLGACLLPEQKSGKIEVDALLSGAERALAESAQDHQPILYKGHRRFVDAPRKVGVAPIVRYGDLHINKDNHRAWIGADAMEFQPKEFDLLLYLLKHEGKLVKREHLCKTVWGYEYFGSSRTVDMHIAKLRKKIKPSRSIQIRTLKGEGYRLDLSS